MERDKVLDLNAESILALVKILALETFEIRDRLYYSRLLPTSVAITRNMIETQKVNKKISVAYKSFCAN